MIFTLKLARVYNIMELNAVLLGCYIYVYPLFWIAYFSIIFRTRRYLVDCAALTALEHRYPEARKNLRDYLERLCRSFPVTYGVKIGGNFVEDEIAFDRNLDFHRGIAIRMPILAPEHYIPALLMNPLQAILLSQDRPLWPEHLVCVGLLAIHLNVRLHNVNSIKMFFA